MDPYIGEVRMFGGSFAPVGWLLCNGQVLSISQYEVLFTLIGTTYGGDGVSTFAVPDLRGRSPIHAGQGPGRSNRMPGDSIGSEAAIVTTPQLPAHTHSLGVSSTKATVGTAAGNVWAPNASDAKCYSNAPNPAGAMAAQGVGTAGTSIPHENMMPFQVVNFIIAFDGVYPPQS